VSFKNRRVALAVDPQATPREKATCMPRPSPARPTRAARCG
jgi:hypothetical protein